MKILKSKRFWRCVLVIGLVPFLLCLWQGLDGAINGFSILWEPADYGWSGFLTSVLVWSFLYWPAYIPGLVMIIVSIVAQIRLKYA